MEKNLVIVESPSKADTIKKYLGEDFKIMSSKGHIRDLDEKGSGMGIDFTNGYKPNYVVSPDKKKLVSELKKSKITKQYTKNAISTIDYYSCMFKDL